MKYKAIKSMSHNFTHSFVSCMNYVGDGYVFDDLRALARAADGARVQILWLPDGPQESRLTARVRTSIGRYKDWLPKLMAQHGVPTEALAELRTDVFLRSDKQVLVEAYARDDRGREYIQRVSF